MKFFFKTKTFLVASFFAISLGATNSQSKMLFDLQMMHSIFDTRYAPKEWKESHLGWNLDEEYLKAQKKITDNPQLTVKEFHKIIRDFARTSQDYHVSCYFDCNESSMLPFSVKSANGRYFVYSITKKKLDTEVFRINIGDELLSLDDEPVDAIAKKIIGEIDRGVPDTDQALADQLITLRQAAEALDIPQGVVQVKFADKETGKIKEYQMVWHHQPNYYTYHKDDFKDRNDDLNIKLEPANWILNLAKTRNQEKRMLVGGKKSDLPCLGKLVWKNKSENFFQAYIFETDEEEKIGFLRIPDYLGEENEMEELIAIISRFEKSTSKLVIDQCNNPGGSVFYLYAIASLLSEKPLKTPKHKFLMTSSSIASYRKKLQTCNNIFTNKQALKVLDDYWFGVKNSLHFIEMLKVYYRFLINEWETGKEISDPVFFAGVDQINPNPEVTYTKPILVLINELDFSGGDFFPALMQDNKRAILMGNRTSGAGGAVKYAEFPNRNGIAEFSYTYTLAQRPGSDTPLENLGVTPDIIYKTSEEDLRNGFREHKAAILKVLKSM